MQDAYIDLTDGRMHYLKDGAGPPLLMLHSAGASSKSWNGIMPRLAPHYAVYALDALGNGDSSKPAKRPWLVEDFGRSVVEFMDKLGINQAYLVGNSVGSQTALEVAVSHPERVLKLVIVGFPGWDEADKVDRRKETLKNFDASGKPIPTTFEALKGRFTHPTQELLDWQNSDRAKAGPFLREVLQAVYAFDSLGKLARCTLPTLSIYGTRDVIFRKEPEVRKRIKRGASVIMQNAGHLPHIDDPDTFMGHVLPFLQGAPKGDAVKQPSRARAA